MSGDCMGVCLVRLCMLVCMCVWEREIVHAHVYAWMCVCMCVCSCVCMCVLHVEYSWRHDSRQQRYHARIQVQTTSCICHTQRQKLMHIIKFVTLSGRKSSGESNRIQNFKGDVNVRVRVRVSLYDYWLIGVYVLYWALYPFTHARVCVCHVHVYTYTRYMYIFRLRVCMYMHMYMYMYICYISSHSCIGSRQRVQ